VSSKALAGAGATCGHSWHFLRTPTALFQNANDYFLISQNFFLTLDCRLAYSLPPIPKREISFTSSL